MKLSRLFLFGLLAVPAFSSAVLFSKSIAFNDPDGTYTYSGSVQFTQSGNLLNVVLTNTATDPANFKRRVLTGVFWDISGSPSITANSAAYTSGSVQLNGGDTAANIGKHWGYKQGLAANQWGNANYGISATGLGYFGPPNAFISGTAQQGIDYGLVPAAGTSLGDTVVKNSMTFALNLPTGYVLNEGDIKNVWFQYGSDVSEFYASVPEPGSMAALAIGAAAFFRRRRKR
ncbi:MAG: hypothetical protein BGO01_09965 [Armatimonadetes bacterium 55-13]|nr:PEP-CTERM sorting domain-containing protein [Armatimonadota bacterium]OJU62726.1 MAG: hypothetical protein BGO01_09965 [Armatimonadetes bacterium 55-13]